MHTLYYDFPLDAKKLIQNKNIAKCDIKQSIANHLHLIMTTHFGECHFDKAYGCALWKVDFNNLANDSKLMTLLDESLFTSLKKYEPRLGNLEIVVEIEQKDLSTGLITSAQIKKHVIITIAAIVKKTNEHIEFEERFYIAPLSY